MVGVLAHVPIPYSPGARGLALGSAGAGEYTSPLEPGWQIMWLVTRWL